MTSDLMKIACFLCVCVLAALPLIGCDAPTASPTTASSTAPPPPPPPGAAPGEGASPPAAATSATPSAAAPASGASASKQSPQPGYAFAKKPEAPAAVRSDPSLPVLGPLEVKDFVDEFLADSPAASKKYEKRRVRIRGQLAGAGSKTLWGVTTHAATVGVPGELQGKLKVTGSLDVQTSIMPQELVVMEGDFQEFASGVPKLAYCTITKVSQ